MTKQLAGCKRIGCPCYRQKKIWQIVTFDLIWKSQYEAKQNINTKIKKQISWTFFFFIPKQKGIKEIKHVYRCLFYFIFLNEWPSAVLSDHSCCDIVVTGLIILGFTSLSFVMFQSELVIKTNKALFFYCSTDWRVSVPSCERTSWVSLLSALVLLKHGRLDKWFDLNKGKLHIDWEP